MSSSASMLHAGTTVLLSFQVCAPVFSGSLRRFQRCADRQFLLRFRLITAHHGHTVRAALCAAALRFPHPPWLAVSVATAGHL